MGVPQQPQSFPSRAGLKLDHALMAFEVDVAGLVCADFGCNVGGFTDCLLKRGAAHVFALDTAYGVLDYRLRTDPRVTVMERTNALHCDPPQKDLAGQGCGNQDGSGSGEGVVGGVQLVTIDLGWTPQRLAIPAALPWLKPTGVVVTLVKPHYELTNDEKRDLLIDGSLDEADSRRILDRVLAAMPDWGVKVIDWTQSPITGGKSARKAKGPRKGNVEYLVLCRPTGSTR